jgi:hypothetical protein
MVFEDSVPIVLLTEYGKVSGISSYYFIYRYDKYEWYLLLHTMCLLCNGVAWLLLCARSVADWRMDEGLPTFGVYCH